MVLLSTYLKTRDGMSQASSFFFHDALRKEEVVKLVRLREQATILSRQRLFTLLSLSLFFLFFIISATKCNNILGTKDLKCHTWKILFPFPPPHGLIVLIKELDLLIWKKRLCSMFQLKVSFLLVITATIVARPLHPRSTFHFLWVTNYFEFGVG